MEYIVIIAIAIILIIIAFFIGRKFASAPIEDNNNKIREQQKELENQIEKLDVDIEWKNQKLRAIEKQYMEKLKIIEDTEALANKAAKEYETNLKNQFEKSKKVHDEKIEQFKNDIQIVQEELESLRATKAAAIEAARKEELIHKEQQDYCLIIPAEEKNDISLLNGIKLKITKPRAISSVIWSAYFQPIAKKRFPKILGATDVCGIYKITNQITGECYIGQSNDCRKRWNDHCRAACGIDTPAGNKLYAAMQEYGLENFSFELLEECSASKLNEKERYFISLYSADTLGYNSQKGNN